jgi:hypothetical protein
MHPSLSKSQPLPYDHERKRNEALLSHSTELKTGERPQYEFLFVNSLSIEH